MRYDALVTRPDPVVESARLLLPPHVVREPQAQTAANPAKQLRAPVGVIIYEPEPHPFRISVVVVDTRLPPDPAAILGILDAFVRLPGRYRVSVSAAVHGWGPVLYQLAMAKATERDAWLEPSPSRHQSREARAMWRRFMQRDDISCREGACQAKWPTGSTIAVERGDAYVRRLAWDRGISVQDAREVLGVEIGTRFLHRMLP